MVEIVRLNEPGARTIRDARPLVRDGAQVVVHYKRSTGDLMAYTGTKLLKVGFLADASTLEILEWFLAPQEVEMGYDFNKHVFFISPNPNHRVEGETARKAMAAFRRDRRSREGGFPAKAWAVSGRQYSQHFEQV